MRPSRVTATGQERQRETRAGADKGGMGGGVLRKTTRARDAGGWARRVSERRGKARGCEIGSRPILIGRSTIIGDVRTARRKSQDLAVHF